LLVTLSSDDRARVIAKILPYWGNDRLRLAKALGYETTAVINEWLEMLEVEADVIETLKGPSALVAKRARLIKKLPRPLQIPAAEVLNERGLTDYDTRKFINALIHNPTESPSKVAEMLEAMPRTKTVMVSLSENVNLAYEAAMVDFRLIKSKLLEKAAIEFVTKHGYLDAEGRVVKREATSTASG
jgi:ParB-like chromosome segregation protein Spo0J